MEGRTQYARSGDVNIAYQVVGDGPIDLVLTWGWLSHIEVSWEDPDIADLLTRLTAFSRLILFDKRGTGMSDRVTESQLPPLEQRMDDVRAVMDAAGSSRAALLGISEGGTLSSAGSGIIFEDRGIHALKGVPDRWQLYAARA